MRPRLKNRQMQIPNGLTFYLPTLKWRAPRYASFSVICQQLYGVIHANPKLAIDHKWPMRMSDIEDWVDLYNATVCARMGWTSYLMEEGAANTIPKSSAPHQRETLQSLKDAAERARELVSGAKTLMEWDDSGEPAVPTEQSTRRALTCVQCPKNDPGDWTKWFTVPAAELIRRRVERAQKRNLTTPSDGDLGLCAACNCPLRLKVHIPIAWIIKRLSPKQLAGMKEGKNCWVIAESQT